MASAVSRGNQAIHLHQPDGSRSKLVASQSVRKPTINMTKWEREGLLRQFDQQEEQVGDPLPRVRPVVGMLALGVLYIPSPVCAVWWVCLR